MVLATFEEDTTIPPTVMLRIIQKMKNNPMNGGQHFWKESVIQIINDLDRQTTQSYTTNQMGKHVKTLLH